MMFVNVTGSLISSFLFMHEQYSLRMYMYILMQRVRTMKGYLLM